MSDEMGGAVASGGDSGGGDGGGSAAAADVPASNFAATGGGGGGAQAEPEGDEGADPKDGKPRAPKLGRFKLQRGGAEVEASLEELQSWSSDAYEHTVKVDGKEERMRYPDLVRNASLGKAALKRMADASAAQKALASERSDWLTDHHKYFAAAGKDPYEWAVQLQIERNELDMLKQTDPDEYIRKRDEMTQKQAKMREGFTKQKADADAKRKAANEQRTMLMRQVPGELAKLGLGDRYSKTLHGIVAQIASEAAGAGAQLSADQLAGLARDSFLEDVRNMLEGLDVSGIESLLGDGVLKKMKRAAADKVKSDAKAAMGGSGTNGNGRPKQPEGAPRLSLAQAVKKYQ